MIIHPYLPAHIPAEQIVARIGLIADTHMPKRCAALPPSLFEILSGVDLLLHAGDVGDLWVLDRLSAIAPVVAVHGNDDLVETSRELPYQQLVAVAGQRILLWHSHYLVPEEERASRQDNSWPSKLARRAEQGQRAGAQIVVFGHTHIPLSYTYQDILLVNPGAIAADNLFTRQTRQTVAILFIKRDGPPVVTHIDLAAPWQPYTPALDWEASFKTAWAQFSASLAPDLAAEIALFKQQTFSDLEAIEEAILPITHRCWAGQQQYVTRAELLQAVLNDPHIPAADRAKVEKIFNPTNLF